MRKRRESDSFRVSQRSNALAFGPRSFLSASSSYPSSPKPNRRPHASVLSQIDGNGPARPRSVLTTPNDHAKAELADHSQTIRSLIPPEAATRRSRNDAGITLTLRQKRRQSNASFGSVKSTKSMSSSIRSWRRVAMPKPTLPTLPSEILGLIFAHLPQKDLLALMLVSRGLTEVAANVLYHEPKFASTYRYAQFAHTVSHVAHYADRVRILDVSGFTNISQYEREPEAGWREWKFRNHDLYRATRARESDVVNLLRQMRRRRVGSTHPQPNPFLEAWALSRDIPLGGLCHALQACQFLTTVNISRVQLAVDYIVRDSRYPPTTWTSQIYVSDVPKSWTWKAEELLPIHNIYIIDQLRKLTYLETVIANNSVSLSTTMIQELVDGCGSLKWVDFRNSGLERKPWAVRGRKEDVVAIIRKMEEEGMRSPGATKRGLAF